MEVSEKWASNVRFEFRFDVGELGEHGDGDVGDEVERGELGGVVAALQHVGRDARARRVDEARRGRDERVGEVAGRCWRA